MVTESSTSFAESTSIITGSEIETIPFVVFEPFEFSSVDEPVDVSVDVSVEEPSTPAPPAHPVSIRIPVMARPSLEVIPSFFMSERIRHISNRAAGVGSQRAERICRSPQSLDPTGSIVL